MLSEVQQCNALGFHLLEQMGPDTAEHSSDRNCCCVQAPQAMDALGSYVLVAFAPLELTLLHVVMTGALSPTGKPAARVKVVRELSIMSVGQPITVRQLTKPCAPQNTASCKSLHRSIHPCACVCTAAFAVRCNMTAKAAL